MMIRRLVLTYCLIRLLLAAGMSVASTPDSLPENVTLRVICAALGGSRGNRQSDQFGGLSAALETAHANHAEHGQPQ